MINIFDRTIARDCRLDWSPSSGTDAKSGIQVTAVPQNLILIDRASEYTIDVRGTMTFVGKTSPPIFSFAILAIGSISILTGCSSFKQPNEKNFMNSLNAYYSAHDECLFTNTLSFPYETARNDQSGAGSKGMDALTASDLMKRQEAKLIGVNRYILTPAGERAGGRFCYGRRKVVAVPSFTPPAPENGMPTTTVTYRYKLRDLPVWADTDAMRGAFPALAKSTSSDPQDTAKLQLTINGWVIADTK